MILETAVASTKMDVFAPQPFSTNETEQIVENRKKQDAAKAAKAEEARDVKEQEAKESKEQEVRPEEILDQIKTFTKDGLYGVRFERNEDLADVVMQIYDRDNEEIIRQVPAEELIKFRSSFREMIGNLIDTKV